MPTSIWQDKMDFSVSFHCCQPKFLVSNFRFVFLLMSAVAFSLIFLGLFYLFS